MAEAVTPGPLPDVGPWPGRAVVPVGLSPPAPPAAPAEPPLTAPPGWPGAAPACCCPGRFRPPPTEACCGPVPDGRMESTGVVPASRWAGEPQPARAPRMRTTPAATARRGCLGRDIGTVSRYA